MFTASSSKSFFLTVLFLLGASGCGWRAASETPASNRMPFAAPEIVSDIPFSTKEPDVFQTEIVVSHFSDGEKNENIIVVARSGERRLTVFNLGAENEIAWLAADGKILRIHRAKKIYAEEASGAENAAGGELEAFIRTEWLNGKTPARFENLGAENNLTRFRVRREDEPDSEALIFVDENLKLPVRQEFYAVAGERKILTVAVELKNFKPAADETLFQTPPGYKKVSAKEFHQILWREKFKK